MSYNPKKALPIKGFPFIFRDANWKTADLVSVSMFNRFTTSIEKGKTYYIFNDKGEFIDRILELGKFTITDLEAIDLPQWINDSFNKKSIPPTSKLLFIFNIGMEVGKSGFSDTMLNSIVVTNINKGYTTILASNDLNVTTFKRNYPQSARHIESGRQILR